MNDAAAKAVADFVINTFAVVGLITFVGIGVVIFLLVHDALSNPHRVKDE